MDMSVKIPTAREQDKLPQKSAAMPARPGAANASDLEIWLQKVEAMGELKRITAEVDPDLEAATITYLVGSEKSPALLFENIKGHPGHRALYNMIGCNLSRFCLMIGEEPVDHPLKAVQILQRKLGRKMPPKEVAAESAICNQNIVNGDAVDIRMFPAQRRGHSTAGCISAPATLSSPRTRRPAHQRRHLSDDDQGPPKSAFTRRRARMRARSREMVEDGKTDADRGGIRDRSVAISRRGDELAEDRERIRILFRHQRRADRTLPQRSHWIAATCARRDHSGRFRLSKRDIRRGTVRRIHRLLRPAQRTTPYMRVERVRYRDNPTLTCALMAENAANEAGLFWACLRAAGIWADLQKLGVPGVRRVVDPGGRGLGASPSYRSSRCMPVTLRRHGVGGAVHGGRVLRKICDRGRRRYRSDQCASGVMGDGDTLAAVAVYRHPARDLEHVSRPEPEPAGNQTMGIEMPDQRLHGYRFIKTFSPRAKLSKETCERWFHAGRNWD